MKMKLIKRQILDEREEQLVNKAGMESFSLMLCGSLALYMGSVAMNGGVVYYQPFLLLILISSFYFMCRTQYLGANYYNSFSLTIWGVLAATGFLTLLIGCQNFQLNHAIYHNSVFHPHVSICYFHYFCHSLSFYTAGQYFLGVCKQMAEKAL